jgi:hypothetical protein
MWGLTNCAGAGGQCGLNVNRWIYSSCWWSVAGNWSVAPRSRSGVRAGVFVDVEMGLNTRSQGPPGAGDPPNAPAFVETVPSKGYRFIGDVEVVSRV